jgi:hypothetical protein
LSPLPSRIRALAELRAKRELLLFAQVSACASAVPLLMRLPLTRSAALLTRAPGYRSPSSDEVERLDRLTALAPRVAHPLVRHGCLTRGVTLFWFLRRAGLDVELRFGVDPGGESTTHGHCWLTLNGEPYLERLDPRPRFVETYRIPLPSG